MAEITRGIPLQVDQAMVRTNAFFTVIIAVLTAVGALVGYPFISAGVMAILAVDFYIRGFHNPRNALITRISTSVVGVMPFTHTLIYFPPKQFAARVGMLFSLTTAILLALGMVYAAVAVVLTLAVFALLECVANLCMGCIVYSGLMSLRRKEQ
jgi:uncharacterized membrane protein YphA (DoxX/SURF4 family)